MERDRDAVMEYYASAVPGSLDDLVPEERRQVHKLRPRWERYAAARTRWAG